MKRERVGRLLSLVLRHQPESLGLSLDQEGYVPVEALLSALQQRKNIALSLEDLEQIVAEDNKARYGFDPEKKRIRARQGHSLQVDLGLLPQIPPNILYHGTATKYLESILQQGLLPQTRQYVHLSQSLDTAKTVGRRHGELVLFQLETAALLEEGHHFFLSENAVWLTDFVPAKALTRMTL